MMNKRLKKKMAKKAELQEQIQKETSSELSLEDLEKVSGGGTFDNVVRVDENPYTEKDKQKI